MCYCILGVCSGHMVLIYVHITLFPRWWAGGSKPDSCHFFFLTISQYFGWMQKRINRDKTYSQQFTLAQEMVWKGQEVDIFCVQIFPCRQYVSMLYFHPAKNDLIPINSRRKDRQSRMIQLAWAWSHIAPPVANLLKCLWNHKTYP